MTPGKEIPPRLGVAKQSEWGAACKEKEGGGREGAQLAQALDLKRAGAQEGGGKGGPRVTVQSFRVFLYCQGLARPEVFQAWRAHSPC